ncbi:MAG: hypothetical protein NZ908_00125 [Candidatus Micrarchaeota archaeon]|nr:hypothetical protein [Candidatus Micrarchaeota archaeon]MCX8154224.1 hypothetical protein [Candidatus Micrarchaeota archaeon]
MDSALNNNQTNKEEERIIEAVRANNPVEAQVEAQRRAEEHQKLLEILMN